jgi:serine/threonine protein kinase
MAKTFGQWEVLRPAKEGGQGHVFKVKRASDEQLGALKRLKNPARIQRFKNEIQAAQKLNHPNIAQLLDVDTSENPEFVVFEWEDGGSLADIPIDVLADMDLDMRLACCEQVANALAYSHKHGVIHRDVKPDNVLISLDRGRARLCDFGLVYFEDGERVTASMEQVGSRYYIAPECEDGRATDISPSTDLYSLGKLIYYLVSGGRIFARERQRQAENVLPQISGNPFIEHVASIIDRLVIDEPQQRIQSADEVAERIRIARHGLRERLPYKGIPSTYRCVFCGTGTYKFIAASHRSQGHNAGYANEGNIGNEYFAFYECPDCGNSQRFKVKYSPFWFPELSPQETQPGTVVFHGGMSVQTARG